MIQSTIAMIRSAGLLLLLTAGAIACNLTASSDDPSTPTPVSDDVADVCNASTDHPLPIYPEPHASSTPIGELTAGELLPVLAASDTGWNRVNFEGNREAWIVGTYNLTGACDNLPVEQLRPTSDCIATNTSSTQVLGIYASPDSSSEPFIARFQPGVSMPVFAAQNGWFKVYIEAFDNYGWTAGEEMSVEGNCDNLPTE